MYDVPTPAAGEGRARGGTARGLRRAPPGSQFKKPQSSLTRLWLFPRILIAFFAASEAAKKAMKIPGMVRRQFKT